MNSPMLQVGGEVGKHSHEIAMNLIQLARVSMQANHVKIAVRALGALEYVASVQNTTVRDCVFGVPSEESEQESTKLLRELLAVVHRDGGHTTDAIGIAASVELAMQKVSQLNATQGPE